jgi:hypothetical protein
VNDFKNNNKSAQWQHDQIPSAIKRIYQPNIKSIDVQETHHPNHEMRQQDLDNAFSAFIINNPCLQSLKLSWVKFPNHLLKLVVDTCVDLREITLIGCKLIDAEHIRYIGTQCKNLRKVELEGIYNFCIRLVEW